MSQLWPMDWDENFTGIACSCSLTEWTSQHQHADPPVTSVFYQVFPVQFEIMILNWNWLLLDYLHPSGQREQQNMSKLKSKLHIFIYNNICLFILQIVWNMLWCWLCVCVGGGGGGGGGGGVRRDKSADYIYLAFSGGYFNFHLFWLWFWLSCARRGILLVFLKPC